MDIQEKKVTIREVAKRYFNDAEIEENKEDFS